MGIREHLPLLQEKMDARIDSLAEQVHSDMTAVLKELEGARDRMEAGLGDLRGVLREGFDGIAEELQSHEARLEEHEKRLRRLEQDRPPAA